jgi:hypothetical protein
MWFVVRARLGKLALDHRVVTMVPWREAVEAGAFLAYVKPIVGHVRRIPSYVDRILRGAKPAELPVQQPTEFELVINLKPRRPLASPSRRRSCCGRIASSAALPAEPLAAEAQPMRKVPHVGIAFSGAPVSAMLGSAPSNPAMKGLLQGFRNLGYVDGQNVILEPRSAEGKYERLSDIMAEFIRQKVDLIIAGGNLDDR